MLKYGEVKRISTDVVKFNLASSKKKRILYIKIIHLSTSSIVKDATLIEVSSQRSAAKYFPHICLCIWAFKLPRLLVR